MKQVKKQLIVPALISKAMSYREYRDLIKHLLEEEKTTGPNQSPELTEYTRLNVQRMKRLDKTLELNNTLIKALKNVNSHWIWLILTEGWCGDAAQNIPVIQKMSEVSFNIQTKFVLRDEHPELMDQYLTNGGRSIPKLICLDSESLEEVGTWGPRPGEFQDKAMQWKDDPNLSKEDWAEKLHHWYARDKSQTIQSDFEDLTEDWIS